MTDALWSVVLPAVPACVAVMVAVWAWDETDKTHEWQDSRDFWGHCAVCGQLKIGHANATDALA